MIECSSCGREIDPAARGCMHCGEPRADVVSKRPPPPPPIGVHLPSHAPARPAERVGASPWILRALVGAAALLLLGGGWLLVKRFWPWSVDAAAEAAFEGRLEELGRTRPDALVDHPAIVGRLVAIEREQLRGERTAARGMVLANQRERLSPAHAYLSSELAASSPDEVGSVARIECQRVAIGRYVDRRTSAEVANGYRWFCQVELIDVARGVTTYRHQITGDPPPEDTRASVDRFGPRPDARIAAWLESLPRR